MGSLWNRSGTVERFADDLKASGAQAFFFQGGTTTPFTVYLDAAEGSAHPHPVVADAFGRWPDVFVPYTLGYDVQVKTAEGVQLTYTQNIPNPDPVELVVTPDPVADVVTGMIHGELANTTKTGYVRLNGRTMGNASSSGTERANADTSALFTYLWNNLTDAIAPVSGGRGASAAADFAANKTITLPDTRGAMLVGLDDMGNSAGSFFSGLTFATGNATTAGSRLGANGITLVTGNLPAHSHTGTTAADLGHSHNGTSNAGTAHTHTASTNTTGAHTHTINITDPTHFHNIFSSVAVSSGAGEGVTNDTGSAQQTAAASTGITASSVSNGDHSHTVTVNNESAHTHTFTTDAAGAHAHTFTTDTQGSGTAFNNLPRSYLVTWYIKL